MSDNPKPYGSYGNGSAMRACAVGFAFDNLEQVFEVAKQSAKVTNLHFHNRFLTKSFITNSSILHCFKHSAQPKMMDGRTRRKPRFIFSI